MTPQIPSPEVIAQDLGYTEAWFRLGVVDNDFLAAQYTEFQNSEDKNQEHYRHRAFVRFLQNRTRLSDEEVNAVFELTDEGPDGSDLRSTRIIELIGSNHLTDAQLASLDRFPLVFEPAIQKIYRRRLLLHELAKEGVIDEVFNAVRDSNDKEIHLAILKRNDLREDQLQWLVENGLNISIRNQAIGLLKRFRRGKGVR